MSLKPISLQTCLFLCPSSHVESRCLPFNHTRHSSFPHDTQTTIFKTIFPRVPLGNSGDSNTRHTVATLLSSSQTACCLLPYLSSLLTGALFSRCDLRKLLIHQLQKCDTLRLLSSIRANPPNPSTKTIFPRVPRGNSGESNTRHIVNNFTFDVVLSPPCLSSSLSIFPPAWGFVF